jgi:hypothetical protein
MGLPRYHEQPVLLLLYRTIHNLEFIEQRKHYNGPFEVTQLINSFLAAVAHPWDQLLDKRKLEDVTLDSRTFRECGFPAFPRLPVEGEPAQVENACQLLRVLRNGIAHGNMELLDRTTLRRLRPTGPLPRVKEDEIAGIKLWNRKSDEAPTTWCTALGVYELQQILMAMMRLCEKRSLWRDEVRTLQEQRDAERKARRAR